MKRVDTAEDVRRGTRRRLAVGFAAIATWLALSAIAPASGWACSTAEFIGVRGSGEDYSTNYGMGATIKPLYDRVAAHVPSGKTLARYGLDYPAVNVTQWWTAWYYPFSVNTGKANLENRLHNDGSSCPSMKIVIGGFSQGAHVVGDAMEELANNNDSILGHVYGVAIYGDPRFSKDDHATARGDYDPNHWGIFGERNNYSSLINNRLGDWCRIYDAICQGFNAGDTAHHEYVQYLNGAFLDQGASLMRQHLGW
ncbi:MAG: cutinase family protein [Solirubrobacteraceae bacterium]|nr:MAG: hypothetical protein DLM63_07980 [Solirubrobacterales bacterium]